MKSYIFRKIVVALIFIIPIFSWSGCKKQVKCGCDGDILRSLTDELMSRSQIIYSSDGTSAYFSISNGYLSTDTYYFCNPGEMFAKSKALEGDDQIYISGDLYWECNYMMSSSNNSYYSYYYKAYNIDVTELRSNLYGKK